MYSEFENIFCSSKWGSLTWLQLFGYIIFAHTYLKRGKKEKDLNNVYF